MGKIPEDVIGLIIDRCDIADVISSYIPLKRAGRSFKALCPFHHEKTPSFVVNPDKQIFHCFGCGAGGNVVSFVMKQERLEFPEAVRFLAGKAGVTIPTSGPSEDRAGQLRQQLKKINELAAQFFHERLFSDKSEGAQKARSYLKQRKLSLETIKKFQVGYAPDQWHELLDFLQGQKVALKLMEQAGLIIPQSRQAGFYDRFRNRIMFPIFDVNGRCLAFGGRALDQQNQAAKYINSPETLLYSKGHHLYGFQFAKTFIGQEDRAIVVEGYLDLITPFQEGLGCLVASCGTALTVEQIRLLRRYTKNVVMLFDADQAGEAAMDRSLDVLLEEGMNVQVTSLPKEEDPDSLVRTKGIGALMSCLEKSQSLFDFKLKRLMSRYDPRTIEGRAQVSLEMLPTINRLPNAIIKSEYLKKLSQTLGVAHEAIVSEFRKIESSGPGSKREIVRRAGSEALPKSVRVAERDLLRLMLLEKEFISWARDEIVPDDFQDRYIRDIVTKIFVLADEGQDIHVPLLLGQFEDQKFIAIISSLLVSQESLVGDRKKIFKDCIRRLKDDRLKSQRQNLMRAMEGARDAGDQQRLEELTIAFNQLIKRE